MGLATFAYWNIRGLAQPIRLLLAYAGQEFKEVNFDINNQSEWSEKIKPTVELDFPNLPYYIDGDVKLTQSMAILKYIARKHNLSGTTDNEKIRVDLLESQIQDYRNQYYAFINDPAMESLKGDYLKNLTDNLTLLSKFMGKNNYFAGKNVTYVDFIIYDYLQQNKIIKTGYLDQFSILKKYEEEIEGLPKVANFLKTSPTLRWQFNGARALVGNKYIPY